MRKFICFLIVGLMWVGISQSYAQGNTEQTKEEALQIKRAAQEERQKLVKEKRAAKAIAAQEKRRIADEKAEAKRVKNLQNARKSYDKSLNKKQKTEIKLAKKRVKYEQARQKGKATSSDLSKMGLEIKKLEIAVEKAEGDAAKHWRTIERNSPGQDRENRRRRGN